MLTEEEEPMTDKAKVRPDLQVIPMQTNESLYIVVDVGKFKHIAGFVSTTLCDEIFPKLTCILKDPNGQTALALRKTFPTPWAVAMVSLSALQTVRLNRQLTDAKLAELQRFAELSIGVKDPARLRGLVFEQGQLIGELKVIPEHP